MRLFDDNVGLVHVVNKNTAVPAELNFTITDTEDTVGMSVFVTGFQASSSNQFQLNQNLLNEFTVTPFGRECTVLDISGFTFSQAQFSSTTRTAGNIDEKALATKQELQRANHQQSEASTEVDTFKILTIPDWSKTISDKKANLLDSSIVTGISGAVGAVSGFVGKVADSIAGSLTALKNSANALIPASIQNVLSTIGLGSGIGPAQKEILNVPVDNCYSMFQIYDLFYRLGAGNKSRKSKIIIQYGDMTYRGVITTLNFSALSEGQISGFQFSFKVLCLDEDTITPYETIQKTVTGSSPGNQLVDSLTQFGLSQISESGGINVGGLQLL